MSDVDGGYIAPTETDMMSMDVARHSDQDTQPAADTGYPGDLIAIDGPAADEDDEHQGQAVHLPTATTELSTAGRALIPEILQASLSNLGHNRDGRVVYTTLGLSSLSLNNIDTLSQYVYLQKIVLDNNHLTNLKALENCKSIAYLSATGNQLTEGIFEDLRAASNTLEFLDVTGNRLKSLRGLPQFRYLRTLKVDANQLTKIHTYEMCQSLSLSVFSFSNNQVGSIDNDAFVKCPIRSLNAGQNHLADLSCFVPLQKTISTLGLADNNIMHFTDITSMQRLHTVDFSGNNIYDIGEVHNLAQIPLLRTVSLTGNPLCSLHDNAMNIPDDDDDASDIVQPDEGAGGGGASSTTGADESSSKNVTPTKPALIGSQGLTTKQLGNRERRQEAALTSANMFVSEDDDIAALSPQEEDKIQFLTADSESQYRLRVVWRAPNITQLDGQAVLPSELGHAKKLEGGATRERRTGARSQFITSGGSAAYALRQKQRHQDPPRIGGY